ncbi:MAG TPA: HEAT repeat domain-containing protein [Steroidobacter sp.]
MIETDILAIFADAIDGGKRLNEIADEFRSGRDVNELLVLLDSDNFELVSAGAWILGELSFDLYNSDRFLSRLRALLDHQDPAVRFRALSAVFPALNGQDAATLALLSKLRSDPNEGVRMSAEAAAARLLT